MIDFDKFDNDTDPSDDNYSAYVAWLSSLIAEELRWAKGNPERQKRVLCRYYSRGLNANLTVGELIDFLGVSSPSILDMAEYSDNEGDALFQISDRLTPKEISRESFSGLAAQVSQPLD